MEPVEADILLSTLRVACNDRDFVLLDECLGALGGAGAVPEDEHHTLTRVAAAQVARCASGAPTPDNLGALSTHMRAAFSAGFLSADLQDKGIAAAQTLDAMVRG